MNGFFSSGFWQVLGLSLVTVGATRVARANDPIALDNFYLDANRRSAGIIDSGMQQQWIKFRDQMVFQAQKAADSLCESSFLPQSIALSAEFIKVKWDTKDLCSPRARSLLAASVSATQLQGTGTASVQALAATPLATQDFVGQVAEFICKFPVLPSDVDLKIPPVTIDWNTAAMCHSI
jgi:hypothetical protein